MIEWESQLLDILMCAIEEIIACKVVRLIHMLRSIDRLEHRTNDIGIDDCEVEGGLPSSDEVLGRSFCQLLPGVVA